MTDIETHKNDDPTWSTNALHGREDLVEGLKKKIDDFFDGTKESIESLLYLEEREEKQLIEAKQVWEDVYDSILKGMKDTRTYLIGSYVPTFNDLCDDIADMIEDNEAAKHDFTAHNTMKQSELAEVVRTTKLAIGYLWIMTIQ